MRTVLVSKRDKGLRFIIENEAKTPYISLVKVEELHFIGNIEKVTKRGITAYTYTITETRVKYFFSRENFEIYEIEESQIEAFKKLEI